MRLTVATRDAIKFACLHYHYAQTVPVNTIGFNVYNAGGEWCGVIVYGTGANCHIGSEYGVKMGEILELVRVALNGKQEATSQAVAASLKMIHEKCPLCRLILSYADMDQGHLGTIYQATNWIYCGISGVDTAGSRNNCWIINGKKTHKRGVTDFLKGCGCLATLENVRRYIDPNAEYFRSVGKRKYLYPLDKRMRKQILPLGKPYPKGEGWNPIDYKAQRAAKKAAKEVPSA